MSSGLKNLQSQARACTRRERLGGDPYAIAAGSHQRDLSGAYTDDSGIGIDQLDDLEAEDEYSSSAFVQHSGGAVQQQQQQQHYQSRASSGYQQGAGQSLTPETDGGKGYDMNGRQYERSFGSESMLGMGGGGGEHERSHSLSSMQNNGYRLPSMGIGSIINQGN